MRSVDTVYIGFGGNYPDTLQLFEEAVAALMCVGSLQMSRLYQTRPLCQQEQPDYLNAVAALQTDVTPWELLAATQVIERWLGKIPKAKDAPRPIDLDILFFKDHAIREEKLELPHPRWHQRLFVVRPLRELTHEVVIDNQRVALDPILESLTKEQNDGVMLSLIQPNWGIHGFTQS
jgi:2-amino-4-hydroxy-6-hydroxymethyldihydropteridine diphosphokinase